jgi:hypothetical protein
MQSEQETQLTEKSSVAALGNGRELYYNNEGRQGENHFSVWKLTVAGNSTATSLCMILSLLLQRSEK